MWVSHAGKILRYSPEQLRRVTADLRRFDFDVNGEQSFSHMFEQIRQQQRYLDVTIEQTPSDLDCKKMLPDIVSGVSGRSKCSLRLIKRLCPRFSIPL